VHWIERKLEVSYVAGCEEQKYSLVLPEGTVIPEPPAHSLIVTLTRYPTPNINPFQ
jgi:hypothetical protein